MDRYLLESGDVLLLEDGFAYLLETLPVDPIRAADGHTVVIPPDRRTVTVYSTHATVPEDDHGTDVPSSQKWWH